MTAIEPAHLSLSHADCYQKPPDVVFAYGTAGFRYKYPGRCCLLPSAKLMPSVAYRMGIFCAARSLNQGCRPVGIMITASHNPEEDNGLKIVDPNGEMLASSWEALATELANCPDSAALDTLIGDLLGRHPAKPDFSEAPIVIIGRDTRASGPLLAQAVIEGALKIGALVQDTGLVTTPQLHFLVSHMTEKGSTEATPDVYIEHLAKSFVAFVQNASPINSNLVLDSANGVGGIAMEKVLAKVGKTGFSPSLLRSSGTGRLNEDCGADFVKMSQRQPVGLDLSPSLRYASFDGDADRLVYYYTDHEGRFRLLDGDKIAAISGLFLRQLLDTLKWTQRVSMGVVQTAYANGASTRYFAEKLGVQVAVACTGVKHLHEKAKQFDIGIYFEANGHGTILFSDRLKTMISEAASSPSSLQTEEKDALGMLARAVDLMHPTVGDAISDLLLVEGILGILGCSMDAWNSLFEDLPSRQLKVQVPDRTKYKTTNEERTLQEPAGLAGKIDEIASEYSPTGRAFVRPSGTEDCMRIYAEAGTAEHAEEIAARIKQLLADQSE